MCIIYMYKEVTSRIICVTHIYVRYDRVIYMSSMLGSHIPLRIRDNVSVRDDKKSNFFYGYVS